MVGEAESEEDAEDEDVGEDEEELGEEVVEKMERVGV